jgi:hypothetical protein
MNKLASRPASSPRANPNMAETLVWEGIALSSEAGAKGGLGALSLAKEAKQLLEESLKLDDKALNGSAYTSLATLYAKVPGLAHRLSATRSAPRPTSRNPWPSTRRD